LTYHILNSGQYTRVIRDVLLKLHYRLEVYVASEGEWKLKAKGSLGCLGDFEEVIGDSIELSELSTVMALLYTVEHSCGEVESLCLWLIVHKPDQYFQNRVSVAFCNLPELRMTIAEFSDTEHFSNLEQLQCLSALSHYLHITDDIDTYEGQFQLVDYKSAGFMYLDMAAVKALELFSLSRDEDAVVGQSGTLFELINKCRTSQGQRLLRDWIRRPLFDLRRINERLDAVEALCEVSGARETLYEDLLRRVPDVASLSRKLLQKKASLQFISSIIVYFKHCYRLYQLIRLLKRFECVFSEVHDSCDQFAPAVNDLCLEPIRLAILQFDKFSALIETTVDVEYFENSGSYRVRPDIDKELMEISNTMKSIEKQCEKELDKISGKFAESVKLDSNSQHGFFFRVTLKVCNTLIFALVKSVIFCSKIISFAAGYTPALQQLSDCLSVVDVLVAFATLAAVSPFPYTRPELLDKESKTLILKNCRHPVIEALPEAPPFIPNDVIMGDESEDKTRFLLLSGANMGGKSTYLRSCALTVLMGQMGCLVPCDSARFSLIDGIHTRIGSCDYQCKGVSTFMAEMIDSATILETATQYSLVIIDELGRGTSTYDGFGLAWAIAELGFHFDLRNLVCYSDLLSRVQCFCVFATHFHEMCTLVERYPSTVRNIRVETQINEAGDLVLLYKVVPGVAERSFGINTAKLVGLSANVIQTANDMLQKLECGKMDSGNDEEKDIIDKLKTLEGEQLREAILALAS
uniref:DNA mismatch repair protein Msh2 (inferred by orthology to a human protein) n=1 Tax=Anisakis simplex TaxID=6269 RepID=A0A0M3K2D2_ANISI